MAGMLAIAGPLIGAGTSIAGSLFGGHDTASNVALPQMWQMPNMSDAASGAFGLGTSLANIAPQSMGLGQAIANNPFAQAYQTGAGVGGGLGTAGALSSYGAGSTLAGSGLSMLPEAQQIMTTAFDPQSALYNRTLQQLTDQTRAGLEARGVDMTPYGAGVEGQTLNNFNIDWQNNLLNRMATGAGAAGGLLNNAGRNIVAGSGLVNAAPDLYTAAAGMPYSTFNAINTQGLGGLQSGAQIPQQAFSDWLGYLGVGNQAGGVANQLGQLGLNANQLAFNQNQMLGSNLGAGLQGLSSLGNLYNNPFSNFSSGNVGGTGLAGFGGLY
jgi:hypothetical protein